MIEKNKMYYYIRDSQSSYKVAMQFLAAPLKLLYIETSTASILFYSISNDPCLLLWLLFLRANEKNCQKKKSHKYNGKLEHIK